MRRVLLPFLASCALCAVPPAARADQFAYLDIRQAVAALEALDGQPVLQSFCAPCGDATASQVAVRDIGIERVWHWDGGAKVYVDADGSSYWEVVVNGEGVDLAYVYVRGDSGWENLAMRIGLQPIEVPRLLPAESPPR